jgi:hypothetical protein
MSAAGLRVVIDTNRLRSEELWAFLAMSPDNRAVLPDYVLMEIHKPGRPDGVKGAFSILGQFPGQILALKGTGVISSLNPDVVDLPEAMICAEETSAIPDFLDQLIAAGQGGDVDGALTLRAGWAAGHMDVMLAGFADMDAAMAEFIAPFTDQELRTIRQERAFTPVMEQKFWELIVSMALPIFAAKPELTPPSLARRADHFVFRNSLCYAIYMMERVRTGGRPRRADRARNDAIDVLLATYGTYFDGVMSEDALTNETYAFTHEVFNATTGKVGRNYLEVGFPQVRDYRLSLPGDDLLGGALTS